MPSKKIWTHNTMDFCVCVTYYIMLWNGNPISCTSPYDCQSWFGGDTAKIEPGEDMHWTCNMSIINGKWQISTENDIGVNKKTDR